MTSFFNTNLSNLSNFAERLPEGTIRFVLCTNLANDSNAMRTANLVSIRVIRGGKKLTHSIELDKFVRFVFKSFSYPGHLSSYQFGGLRRSPSWQGNAPHVALPGQKGRRIPSGEPHFSSPNHKIRGKDVANKKFFVSLCS